MATADIPGDGQSRRLDSWKEIAEYLRRDVRTAMRWESQGLPLHRVGGTGRSVFAFTNEIDAWMAGRTEEPETDSIPVQTQAAPSAHGRSVHPLRTIIVSVACTLFVIAVGVVVISSGSVAPPDLARLEVTANEKQVTITDGSGPARVIHQFGPGAVLADGRAARLADLDADGVPEVLSYLAYYNTQEGRLGGSGELFHLSLAGDVRWRFAFDDAIAFAGRNASSPWVLTEWQAEPDASPKRIAIAAHEEQWWASLVALLDHTGRRLAAFVNPGWIESVAWRSPDRLAIAGFNNVNDEGMFAMLDANHLNGQAPGSAGTDYLCRTCPSSPPLFYATFPRSEVNLVTANRFNRARLSTAGDRIVVTTVEMTREGGDATAFYEFDRDLRFVWAQYSDIYWSEHKRLELEGRISHTREKCPDRNGPAAIQVWDAARGWTKTTPSGV